MPMRLTSSDSDVEFELALIEDRPGEFHDEEEPDYHFVTISFRVGTKDDSWEETAPSINLFQLRSLAEWLAAVAEGKPELERVELLEINLSFDVVASTDEDVTIAIGFHLENRPEWAVIDAPTDEASSIRIRMPREEVAVAANELQDDLKAIGRA